VPHVLNAGVAATLWAVISPWHTVHWTSFAPCGLAFHWAYVALWQSMQVFPAGIGWWCFCVARVFWAMAGWTATVKTSSTSKIELNKKARRLFTGRISWEDFVVSRPVTSSHCADGHI
jgi:hypothetical protein